METKICQNCKQEFRIEPEDFGFYEKIKVPPPTFCPHCRMMRRFIWRNTRHLFRRKDSLGKEIFSGFPPHSGINVYELLYWNSDEWEPMDYGQDYDFPRPFFEQFREFLYKVPLASRSIQRLINSDYCDNADDLKNCYLVFDMGGAENSAYCVQGFHLKECFDMYEANHNELCLDSSMVDDCYHTFYSLDCENCNNIFFSKDLAGCSNCFGCVGLRNKNYYIFNEPYAKEDYEKKLQEFDLGSYDEAQKIKSRAHSFWEKFPVKFFHGFQNTNVSGEHIQNSKDIKYSYSIHDCENVRYSQMVAAKVSDSYDYTVWGDSCSQMYECLGCGEQGYGLKFCFGCWPGCKELEYSVFCRSSSNLFGCVGLKKKQFCIFNKQYSKEDYFALREKIIKHMDEMPYSDNKGIIYKYGEFFPPEFSPFAYNETIMQDLFPLAREEAKSKGYAWRDKEARDFQTTINVSDLPDHIKDADDSILKEVIKCESCFGAYRIIPMELDFYKKMNLPLPRLCQNCRFSDRLKFINPPQFWHAKCQCAGAGDDRKIYKNSASHFHGSDHCPGEFETSYSPDKKEIVYCEQCYNTEILG